MARIKPKRHGIVTDMTAMCDVTFLLLTFFIMTSQFKKPDVEGIKPPSSISEKILPDGIMTIDVTKDGYFLFSPVENASERIKILEAMGNKYHVTFNDEEKVAFTKVQSVGVPMSKMKSFLNLKEDVRNQYVDPDGIPLDSTRKELIDWVQQSLTVNNGYKLAIKGDVETKYPKMKDLFEGLRDIDFLTFLLVTSQEVGPDQ